MQPVKDVTWTIVTCSMPQRQRSFINTNWHFMQQFPFLVVVWSRVTTHMRPWFTWMETLCTSIPPAISRLKIPNYSKLINETLTNLLTSVTDRDVPSIRVSRSQNWCWSSGALFLRSSSLHDIKLNRYAYFCAYVFTIFHLRCEF